MADWIVVVDDDSTNLKMAGHILSKHNKRVTAMRSGRALLDYIRGNVPDLILLDIRMPEMDGFETLRKLRELEKEMQIEEIPVIFLTAEDDVNSEMRGFEMGVSDYVKKPFEPEVLVKRIDNILGKQERLLRFQEEATTDQLTGLYNKAAFHEKMASVCQRLTGYFLMIDLDSFKLVNDLYGHAMGDQILIEFAAAVQELLSEDSIIGRIGGDEFAAFSTQVVSESDIMQFTVNLNANFLERAKKLLGANMSIPLGASIGAAYVSGKGTEFEEVFKGADKALYKVKTNGKHGYSIFDYERAEESDGQQVNLRTLGMILSERNIPDSA
ncbi:MAG: diguanylate cyclase, partial [Lachnospiraceae bacterium]|nr:diguanylate cyclase [Lachnospiraceae bacterium]